MPAATPQQAVTGYLDALVAADADRALQYALNRPTDTDAAHPRGARGESHKLAGRWSVVDVPEVHGGETVRCRPR